MSNNLKFKVALIIGQLSKKQFLKKAKLKLAPAPPAVSALLLARPTAPPPAPPKYDGTS